jgi:thiol:disulfide interchange protein
MFASTPPGRSTPLLSAIALLTLAASISIVGCKSNQPASSPIASTPTQPVASVPAVAKHLYSAEADPKADIASALKQASLEQKRVILDFGGDWCGDCQVLDIYFHQSPDADLLAQHFVMVHIDIGHMDRNLDVTKKYEIPINKGVPALAVLDAQGKLLYSQQTGQFENMRNMSASSVTDFLNQWKG